MSTQIFVNLPVADLPRSKVFFEAPVSYTHLTLPTTERV